MRHLRTSLSAVLGIGLALGCKSAKQEPCYPHDPLLLSKKPVDGAVPMDGPVLEAQAEPARPHRPFAALFARRSSADSGPVVGTPASSRQPAPITPIPGTGRGPVSALPASRLAQPADAPASPIQPVSGTYGHAADYSWLQGTLDRHYTGHYNLRYCDSTKEDPFGGKVRLEDDPRLANFREGDVVIVQGGLVQEDSKQGWKHFPRYHVIDIRLVQKK
jgi:hypothetical protein